MKNKLAYLFALFAFPVLANTPPVITNVRAEQRKDTKLVDIYYDAADADNDALKVRIEISDDDGAKYSVPAFSLTGDIGEGIVPGTGKHIVWDAGTDWDGEYSDQMRVKVFAIDAQGFPGMEWGNEVPPGGFLMGQDGGAEGSGPSRHVNIPWSYWLSKYEITARQYCDFLNTALSEKYVTRNGTTEVRATASMPMSFACPGDALLCKIGDSEQIRWNVNKFEPTDNEHEMPVSVTWYGAMAFCRYFGYDLPTEAEWEKAARGSGHEDANGHLCYPWGNEVSASLANIDCRSVVKPVGYYDGNQTPIGPDAKNDYGLYDVVGNVPEWTISTYAGGNNGAVLSVETYPQQDSLLAGVNNPYLRCDDVPMGTVYGYGYTMPMFNYKTIRGYDSGKLHERLGGCMSYCGILTGFSISSSSYSSWVAPNFQECPVGFRVARRGEVLSAKAACGVNENFDKLDAVTDELLKGEFALSGCMWNLNSVCYDATHGVDGSPCLRTQGNYLTRIVLPKVSGNVCCIRFKYRCSDSKSTSGGYDLRMYYEKNGSENSTTIISRGTDDLYEQITFYPETDASNYSLGYGSSNMFIDDIEIWTVQSQD